MSREEICGNIFLRKWPDLKAGQAVPGHAHNFDHTTIIFTGSCRVEATLPDGTEVDRVFKAPDHVLIRAGVEHKLTALEDGTEWWCVYSHRAPNGEIEQEYTGHGPAYL